MRDYLLELPDHCRAYAAMDRDALAAEIDRLRKALGKADRESKRLADQRAALGFNATKARRTSALAKWHRAAEERDLLLLMLDAAHAAAMALRMEAP